MTDFYNIDKETIKALEKEIQTLEKIIRHKDKMITRLRNGNVSIIEYYDKLMNLMDRTMSIAKYYKDEVKSYEDIMDADEILTNTLSDEKNIIAKRVNKYLLNIVTSKNHFRNIIFLVLTKSGVLI